MNKILLSIGVGCSLAAGGCSNMSVDSMVDLGSKGIQVATMSDSEIVAASQTGCQALDSQNRVTTAYNSRLNTIKSGLPSSVNGQKINYKVYKTAELNAFAMPNGCVRIYSGLMDKLNNDEMRAVLGHEIGHVALKHSFKQYRTMKAIELALEAGGKGTTGGTQAVVSHPMFKNFVNQVTDAQYSQALETDADNYSVDMMLKEKNGKKRALALASALGKISGNTATDSTMTQKMFGSHPDPKKRIANIENRVAKSEK